VSLLLLGHKVQLGLVCVVSQINYVGRWRSMKRVIPHTGRWIRETQSK
jgi:hypothetical protein